MTRVGIFNCPKVRENDKVEVIYNCDSVNSYLYNCRVICRVHYVENEFERILVELPLNYKKIGTIDGWSGEDWGTSREFTLKPKRLYWWVRTWRLTKSRKSLDLE